MKSPTLLREDLRIRFDPFFRSWSTRNDSWWCGIWNHGGLQGHTRGKEEVIHQFFTAIVPYVITDRPTPQRLRRLSPGP